MTVTEKDLFLIKDTLQKAIDEKKAEITAKSEVNNYSEEENKSDEEYVTELSNIADNFDGSLISKERYLQLAADFDNYKKRIARDNLNTITEANKKLITNFLPIVDDYEKILKSFKNEIITNSPIEEATKLLYNKIITFLKNEGCEKIACTFGDKFDPNFHEALSTREIANDEGYDPGDVCEIYRDGYTLNGKLLRPTLVTVAKEKEVAAE